MNPGVDADLVAFANYRALFVGMQHGGDSGDEERGGYCVAVEQAQDSRDAGAGAVLALAQPARGAFAGA